MTATLHPRHRTHRSTTRPPRDVSNVVPTGYDDTARSCANYAVRRATVALLGVLLVAIVALVGSELAGVLVDVGGRPAAASVGSAGDVPGGRIHVAQPGDTLWSIADRHRGDVPRGRFVDALIDANGGTGIQIGQAVRLP